LDVFENEPSEGIAKFEQSDLADLVCLPHATLVLQLFKPVK
jgi:hypothetical protein